MVTLRPYQQQLLDDIRDAMRHGHRRILAVMPTGSGKGTTIAAMVASAAERGHRVLILAHRAELVADLSQRIHGFGINHGVIASGYREDMRHPVQVGSVQTVVRRLGRIPAPSMVIQDEAHHLVAGNMWGKVIDAWPQAFLIGKTATPERLSGEGLGVGHGGYFTNMVLGPDAAWLTQEGFLVRARVFAPPGIDLSGIRRYDTRKGHQQSEEILRQGQAMGDAVSHYRRTIEPVHNGTAIAFCCSVAHAEAVAEAFRAQGIAAATLDGTMDRGVRRRTIADLGTGQLKVLTSCDIISEGTDIPSVTGAILLRPTDSLGLHLQQVGRVLRPCPGKPHAILNDHVGNTLRHGLPTDPRDWSLEGRPKGQKRKSDAPPVRICPACFSAIPSAANPCP
ncbi:MAG: DEAD/DEAH box helicase, partial [Caulobacteraceae bacterium]|nr:DEAD/DEAH box helicase [Caulobacteraceae bacterium]